MMTSPAPVPVRWPDRPLPRLLQGGTAVGVSSWRLAAEVARAGGLGVVAGTALDLVLARRLQDGDPGRAARRALADLPWRSVVAEVLDRYLELDGRLPGAPYARTPRASLQPSAEAQRLALAAAFAEVHAARRGHDGPVGMHLLADVPVAVPATLYGALVAGVDVVLLGTGPLEDVPALLDSLAAEHRGELPVDVLGAPAGAHAVRFDAREVVDGPLPALRRPAFVAVVAGAAEAERLAADARTRPDGFVLAGPAAGGHVAAAGVPSDEDVARVVATGLPVWLAGGQGTPEGLARALSLGAAGVQAGTVFALAGESGLAPDLRARALEQLRTGALEVRTDTEVSPLGVPFQVAQLPGTLADVALATSRVRPPCDLGYLRRPYVRPTGTVGYQCAAEPVDVFVRKGGAAEVAARRGCLCNSLLAAAGLAQVRDGVAELPLVTLGTDLDGVRRLAAEHPGGWTAADA
jgi:NAD(P)H-dependent flavin oxidoreductase YrpB (nitropropane dioxygenase family)